MKDSKEKKFDEGLSEIFTKATDIRTTLAGREYWSHIQFRVGQITSDYNYLDFEAVDKLASALGYAREHFYNSARLEHDKEKNVVYGVIQLTFSFVRVYIDPHPT